MICVKPGIMLLLSLVLAPQVMAERVWPEKTYECQVKTTSGVRGLVTIQATSLEQARHGVVGELASTTLGGRERAAAVVECIQFGEGEFKDTSFQDWKMQLDR